MRPGLLAVLLLSLAMPAWAGDLLEDKLTHYGKEGHLLPTKCCWVPLPKSKKLDMLRRAEKNCVVSGGPVGRYEIRAGKLWLTGLVNCAGEIELNSVYPDMKKPALATWVNGSFWAELDMRCQDANYQPVWAIRQDIEVDKGVITYLSETPQDVSACRKK